MNTTLQIRIDKKTKDAAKKIFRSMGLDMSSGVKLYLAQVVNKGEVPFRIRSFDDMPHKEKLAVIKDAEYALKHGKRYISIEDAHSDILGT